MAKVCQPRCSAAVLGAQQDLLLCSSEGYSLQHKTVSSSLQHETIGSSLQPSCSRNWAFTSSKLSGRSNDPIAWCNE